MPHYSAVLSVSAGTARPSIFPNLGLFNEPGDNNGYRFSMHPDPGAAAGSDALPIVCSLDHADLADRVSEFEHLFSSALVSHERDGTLLRLNLSTADADEALVRDLFRRESECCQFFTFRIERFERVLQVTMSVPEGAETALDDFERLAAAALRLISH